MFCILFFRILCNLPNTYTFSKSLAEHVVNDVGEDLPVVIFRPSISECVIVMLPFCCAALIPCANELHVLNTYW